MKQAIFGVICILLGLLFQARAQSCYIQLDDATGVDISTYIAELEATACALRDAFPEAVQDSFAVFDFGFYSISKYFSDRIKEIWNSQKSQAQSSSEYFLLIGRKYSDEGTNLSISLNLPSTDIFSCLTSNDLIKIEFEMNHLLKGEATEPDILVAKLKKAMEFLLSEINKLKDCCDIDNLMPLEECSPCSWTSSATRQFLSDMDFRSLDIEALNSSETEGIDPECFCFSSPSPQISKITEDSLEIVKYTTLSGVKVEMIEESTTEVFNKLEELASLYNANGMTFLGVITDNYVFCTVENSSSLRTSTDNPTFMDIMNMTGGYDIVYWVHFQYDNDLVTSHLYTKGVGGNPLINCFHYSHHCSKIYYVVNNLKKYKKGYYNKFVNGILSENKYDVIIKIREYEDATVAGSVNHHSEVLKTSIIEIGLNHNRFTNNKFCSVESYNPSGNICDEKYLGLNYLKTAYYLLHECVHAELRQLVLMSNGSTIEEKLINTDKYSYGELYQQYSISVPSKKLNYTEHHILLKNKLSEIANSLLQYNKNYSQKESYYYMIWNFDYHPFTTSTTTLEGFNDLFKLHYLQFQETSLLIDFLCEGLVQLHLNPNLPCTGQY